MRIPSDDITLATSQPHRYDILSLTNFSLLTVDTILLCTKVLFQICDFHSLYHRRKLNPLLFQCLFCPCTPTESNVYLATSLATIICDPELYRLLAFQVPDLMSPFHCLGCTEGSSQVRGLVRCFITWYVLRWAVVSTSPNPQAVNPPHVGCPWLLIQCIRRYPPYLESVLPSATWGRAMPWWEGTTYHSDYGGDHYCYYYERKPGRLLK